MGRRNKNYKRIKKLRNLTESGLPQDTTSTSLNIKRYSKNKHIAAVVGFLAENYIIFILAVLVWLLYANTLNNDFVILDDWEAIVQDNSLHDFWGTIKKLEYNRFFHATAVHFYGIEAFPFRLISISQHMVNVILAYFLAKRLFGKNVAIPAALLFASHPVITESVDWISAFPHMYIAQYLMIITLLYIRAKDTKNVTYIWVALGVYLFTILTFKSPWLLNYIFFIAAIDIFFLQKKFEYNYLKYLPLFLGPVLLFYSLSLGSLVQQRLVERTTIPGQEATVKAVGLNQEGMTPVIEGYPWSVYSMIRLYVFPLELMTYYDGETLGTAAKVGMYAVSFMYLGVIAYFIAKKNKKIYGLLILMPLCISPVFSPVKITWYIAERYLYLGTLFFCVLLVIAIFGLNKVIKSKINFKHFPTILIGLILVLYSIRTVVRNLDWKDSVAFSLSNAVHAPQSFRPLTNLANYYYYQGDYEAAADNYYKALDINKLSNTAMGNLGLIVLEQGEYGLELVRKYGGRHYTAEEALSNAQYNIQHNDPKKGAFLLAENIVLEENPDAYNALGQLMVKTTQNLEMAEQMFRMSYLRDPNSVSALQNLAFVVAVKGNKQEAIDYLKKTLEIDPSDPNTASFIQQVESGAVGPHLIQQDYVNQNGTGSSDVSGVPGQDQSQIPMLGPEESPSNSILQQPGQNIPLNL